MSVFRNTSKSTACNHFPSFPSKISSCIYINVFKMCILCHCLKWSSPQNAVVNLANSLYDKKINLLNVFPFLWLHILRLLFCSNVGSNSIFQSLPSTLLHEKIFFSFSLSYFINNESSWKTRFRMLLLVGCHFCQFSEDFWNAGQP